MDQTASLEPVFPWKLLIVGAVYAVVEAVHILKTGRSLTGETLKLLVDALLNSIREIGSQDGRERVCGAVVMIPILLAVGFVMYIVMCACTGEFSVGKVGLSAVGALGCVPATIVSSVLNRRYVVGA